MDTKAAVDVTSIFKSRNLIAQGKDPIIQGSLLKKGCALSLIGCLYSVMFLFVLSSMRGSDTCFSYHLKPIWARTLSCLSVCVGASMTVFLLQSRFDFSPTLYIFCSLIKYYELKRKMPRHTHITKSILQSNKICSASFLFIFVVVLNLLNK